eukprot:m.299695 g.299695  ORF g.299695 m.299695 type:complete len:267 (+) comp15873_c0_seq1:2451-3251(+)
MSVWGAVGVACLLGGGYVASIYAFPQRYERNHPTTIKQRILSVSGFCVAAVAGLTLYRAWDQDVSLWQSFAQVLVDSKLSLGDNAVEVHGMGIFKALGAYGILFMGPLVQHGLQHGLSPTTLVRGNNKLQALRDLVFAPITEELVYRGLVLAVLAPAIGVRAACWTSPLLFGFAHLHHLLNGTPPFTVLFQFLYTSLFGWMSAFTVLATDSVYAAMAAHAFCNTMGFPPIDGVFSLPPTTRVVVATSYIVGLASFIYLVSTIQFPQ